jgi:hypothetical protein
MRRPAHGATTRPGPERPAAGYGRPLGRPGPRLDVCARDVGDGFVPEADAFGAGQDVISVSASARPLDPGPTPAA